MNFFRRKKIIEKNKGFTLIELMVSMSIFIIAVLICAGSVTSVFDANQKSKTLRSVMDNLNITLESMTRSIRFGTNYHCGTSGNLSLPSDCPAPGYDSNMTVRTQDGSQFSYSLSNGRIVKTVGGNNYFLTSPDVTITRLAFRVYGSPPYNGGADLFQPQVIVVVSGYVGTKLTTRSTFTLETTVSQRLLDFN